MTYLVYSNGGDSFHGDNWSLKEGKALLSGKNQAHALIGYRYWELSGQRAGVLVGFTERPDATEIARRKASGLLGARPTRI